METDYGAEMHILSKATFMLEIMIAAMILFAPEQGIERQDQLMPMYDTKSEWDDPFEQADERRRVRRFNTKIRINIALESGSARRNLVGPGIVHDMSESGVYCVTKHELTPGHVLTLRFTTEMCSPELCLPNSFYGPAKVVRTVPDEDDRMFVGIVFGNDLKQNMDFSMFVQHLETASITS
jgi:hypothetical protein